MPKTLSKEERKLRDEAFDALDGMRAIVRNEMMIRGVYVSDEVDPAMSDSICQGHRFCAVGSLWIGGGVKPVFKRSHITDEVIDVDLPGIFQGERKDFLEREGLHGLREAYHAINEASEWFIEKYKVRFGDPDGELSEDYCGEFDDPLERLFEDGWIDGGRIDRNDLLKVINKAERILLKRFRHSPGRGIIEP